MATAAMQLYFDGTSLTPRAPAPYPTHARAARLRPALPATAAIAARPGRDRADKPSWRGGEAGEAQTGMCRARRS